MRITIPDIYTESFLSGQRLFQYYTGKIASIIYLNKTDITRAKAWLTEHREADILECFEKRIRPSVNEPMDEEKSFYLLAGGLLIRFEEEVAAIYYHRENKDEADALCNAISSFQQRKHLAAGKPRYCMIATGRSGFEKVYLELPKNKCNIDTHYNDDLPAQEQHLLKCLRNKQTSGLHLLYGVPGTGKSTYLRHIIGKVRGKDFVFLSPQVTGQLDSPQLLTTLLRIQHAILIIEDAEDLLMSREGGRNAGISLLLNLTDGLLGASLGIQVICTFNTNINRVDKALLRGGRLKTLYEFKPLEAAKAEALHQRISLPGKSKALGAMTLAEIFDASGEYPAMAVEHQQRIGFGSAGFTEV